MVVVVWQVKDSLVRELQQKAEKAELLQAELQVLETERVRLSLLEEKLLDVLQLLQQLRGLVSPGGSSAHTTAPAPVAAAHRSGRLSTAGTAVELKPQRPGCNKAAHAGAMRERCPQLTSDLSSEHRRCANSSPHPPPNVFFS